MVRRHIGYWKENKMHGKGVFSWPDWRKYEGEYLEVKSTGMGYLDGMECRIMKGSG